LEAIARGEVPRWDSDQGKYVYGDDMSETMVMGGTSSSSNYQDPQANMDADEDLPF